MLQSQDAKKLAEFCRREMRQRVARVSREASKMSGVMKKLARDMLSYWKKADKEAADAKKQVGELLCGSMYLCWHAS